MRGIASEAVESLTPNRGWSYFALQRSLIGLAPWGEYCTNEHGASATLLPVPDLEDRGYGWTGFSPQPEQFAELMPCPESGDAAWRSLLLHDCAHATVAGLELAEGERDDQAFVTATAEMTRARLELGEHLGNALRARRELPLASGTLHGRAEDAFVHLVARLVPRANDLRSAMGGLRVCELTACVFEGTMRARRLPAHRRRKFPHVPVAVGYARAGIGTMFPPSDPTADYAVKARFSLECADWGDPFESSSLKAQYCAPCGSGAGRVARLRERGGSTARQSRAPVGPQTAA